MGIAETLTKPALVSIALATIRTFMKGGSMEVREGAGFQTIMSFYQSLQKWLTNATTDPNEVLQTLDSMRALLIKSAEEERTGWWIDTLRGFSLLDVGIRRKMGLRAWDEAHAYDNAIEDCCAKPEARLLKS